MSLFVVAYDIAEDRRRRRVARTLERWGTRIQYSVFEVWLEPAALPRFQFRLGTLLARTDKLDIIPVDERSARGRLRWQQAPTDYSPVVACSPAGEAGGLATPAVRRKLPKRIPRPSNRPRAE